MVVEQSVVQLQQLIDLVQPFYLKLSVLLGGVFGIYFLLLIARIYYERRKVHLLEDIRFTLNQANLSHHLRTSQERPTLWRKIKKRLRRK